MAMPTQILERYGNVKHWQIKKMMMCLDMHKKMECMCNDAKQMLEKHFKPLPELVKETGMSEMMLLKMTNMLIEDIMRPFGHLGSVEKIITFKEFLALLKHF